MAAPIILSAIFMFLLSSAFSVDVSPIRQDLEVATEEMLKANYFTFVMLINMAPPNLTAGNITFLMPNDRSLARAAMSQNGVVDFLLTHSIPSPLLFEYLLHIPTGSTIPTGKNGSMLEVSNNGRRSFYLNNVRVISPNICTLGSSIRCHGIDGVVEATTTTTHRNDTPPPPIQVCSRSNSSSITSIVPNATVSAPAPLPSPPPPQPVGGGNKVPSGSPSPGVQHNRPQKSGSSRPLPLGGLSLGFIMACLMLLRGSFL